MAMPAMEHEARKDPWTCAIIGAAMEVHRTLGCGILEPVYQEALAVEMRMRSVPAEREVALPVMYKGNELNTHYRPDFICFGSVIVELKALACIGSAEEAQIMNYPKVSGHGVGLILNFGTSSLEYRRFILSPQSA